jgi:hypothetical protein
MATIHVGVLYLGLFKIAEEVLGVISIDRFARACLCRASLSI